MRSIAYLTALTIAIFGGFANAHEMRPSVADLQVQGQDVVVQVRTNLEAMLSRISPDHDDTAESENSEAYEALRRMEPAELIALFDPFEAEFIENTTLTVDGARQEIDVMSIEVPEVGDTDLIRSTRITFSAPLNSESSTVTFAWNADFGPIVLRALNDEGQGYATMLSGGEATQPIEIDQIRPRSFWQVVTAFIANGYEHVLGFDSLEPINIFGKEVPVPTGLDHILFVLGLFLLSARLAPVLWQVTAFTLAHTVTLALGVLGYVNIPSEIIEPLIAASIVYVALENIVLTQLSPWRPLVVFGFGLLHGLGFAGALQSFAVSDTQFIPSLIGFNIGVELGQLTVIAICFLLVGIWFGQRAWYRYVVTIPGSLIVAAVGAYWFYERVALG